MDQRQGGFHGSMAKVGVVLLDLRGEQHAFIEQRLEGEAGDVKELAAADLPRITNCALGALADDIELALEGQLVGQLCVALDKNLSDRRLGGFRSGAQGGVVCRDRSPAEHSLAFFLHDLGEKFFTFRALIGLLRQKNHSHAILSISRQADAAFFGGELEEFVRSLDEDACAVAGIGFATASAAVVQVQQHLHCLLDDGMGLLALDVHHEADPARVVLELRIVQALLARSSCPGEMRHRIPPHPGPLPWGEGEFSPRS